VADRAAAALKALVELFIARVDYMAAYPSRVVKQNADGTLELVPDHPRLSTYSRVAIRYGIPGVTATVAAGARVLLEFAAGDPSKPIATVWESASVTAITIAGTTVNLGGASGLQGAGLGDQLATALANIVTFLTTHTHAGVTTGGGTSGVSATAPPTIGTVSSGTVKVKP
jgi:hypothetical protein